MARTAIVVRTATPDDADGIAELWSQLRGHGGRGAQYTPAPTVERVLEALTFANEDSSARMLVAVSGDAVVGMALAVLAPVSPFISFQVVQVDYLQVLQGFERQGVGKALLASATAYADEVGCDHLLVNVFPGARDAHRFYARLGFQPVVTRRMAHVSVLRRRLGLETASSAHEGRSARRRAVLIGRRPLASGLRRT
ncbi:MAG TPA: GNAT family N-acetyltransferase [Dermatophilaceae bacterium]|nr:GNAT family N-acetyltransferase [Dermatophilaceae bacterium]